MPTSRREQILVSLVVVLSLLVYRISFFSVSLWTTTASIDVTLPITNVNVDDINRPLFASNTTPYQNISSIFFLHVGKTGGSTLRQQLWLSCRKKSTSETRQVCFDELLEQGESILSKRVQGMVHCLKYAGIPVEEAEAFLFSVRDPLARIVSWFYFADPHNWESWARKEKWDKQPLLRDFYRNCFAQVNDFGMAMLYTMNNNNGTATAKELARNHGVRNPACLDVARDAGQYDVFSHLRYNYAFYYYNTSVADFPERPIFVVRTSHFERDVASIETLLASPGDSATHHHHQYPNITYNDTNKRRRDENRTFTSDGQRGLCCFLRQEYEIYNFLLDHAINIHSAEEEINNPCAEYLKSC